MEKVKKIIYLPIFKRENDRSLKAALPQRAARLSFLAKMHFENSVHLWVNIFREENYEEPWTYVGRAG